MTRETSIAAYHKIRDTIAPGLRREILDLLAESMWPLSAHEIARMIGRARDSVSPRMQELRAMGAVVEAAERRDDKTKMTVVTWDLTGNAPSLPDTKPRGMSHKEFRRRAHAVLGLCVCLLESERAEVDALVAAGPGS